MPLTVLSVAYPLAKVSRGTAGGAEQILLAIDRALVQLGHRSLVVAAAGSRCSGLLLPVQIPLGELSESVRREARCRFKEEVDLALARYSVDIVHMHGLDFHEYQPSGEVPVVVTLHLPLAWYRAEALRSKPGNPHLVCVSRSQAATAPAGAQIASVVPNGIDVRAFQLPRRKGDYALVMGRICPEKGIHLALDAARYAGIPVIVAGTVFDYPEHRRYFEDCLRPRLGVGVRFVGSVGRVRKASLLAGARCLLLSSQAQETSSLIAMEALASGTPVIAWRSGALPEIVTHGRTGWLVAGVEEMADAIRHADCIDRAECRSEAARRFCSERMIADYLSLYTQLAEHQDVEELRAA